MADPETPAPGNDEQEQKPDEQQQPGADAPKADSPKADGPSIADLTRERDEWKTHARTWEARAKENKDAVDKVAELEAELEQARAEAASVGALRLAVEHGLTSDDVDILAEVSDEEKRKALAARLAAGASRSPRPDQSQGRDDEAPLTPRDEFVAMFGA